MTSLSAWRVDDVVTYDVLLGLAGTVTALLLEVVRSRSLWDHEAP